jgi:hypothetical protein
MEDKFYQRLNNTLATSGRADLNRSAANGEAKLRLSKHKALATHGQTHFCELCV